MAVEPSGFPGSPRERRKPLCPPHPSPQALPAQSALPQVQDTVQSIAAGTECCKGALVTREHQRTPLQMAFQDMYLQPLRNVGKVTLSPVS